MKAKNELLLNILVIGMTIILQQGCASNPTNENYRAVEPRSIEELKQAIGESFEKSLSSDSKNLAFKLALLRGNKNINYRWHNQKLRFPKKAKSETIAWFAVSTNKDDSYNVDVYNRDNNRDGNQATATICLSCDSN